MNKIIFICQTLLIISMLISGAILVFVSNDIVVKGSGFVLLFVSINLIIEKV